jgi:hypothetical protein
MDENTQKRFRTEEVNALPYSALDYQNRGYAQVGPAYGPMENQNWIQCEGCDTWRHLPDSVDMTALPEKWYAAF